MSFKKEVYFREECPSKKSCFYQEGDFVAMQYFGQTILRCSNQGRCINLSEVKGKKNLEGKLDN